MILINIEKLLKRNGKTKYWLCKQMNITSRNLNRIIRGDTNSISFKYIEEFCKYLECTPGELISTSNKWYNMIADYKLSPQHLYLKKGGRDYDKNWLYL